MPTNSKIPVVVGAFKTLGHPGRVVVLRAFAAHPGIVRSPTEVCAGLQANPEPMSLGMVSYHTRALVRGKMLKAKGTKPRRGAVEHFYEPTPIAHKMLAHIEMLEQTL